MFYNPLKPNYGSFKYVQYTPFNSINTKCLLYNIYYILYSIYRLTHTNDFYLTKSN